MSRINYVLEVLNTFRDFDIFVFVGVFSTPEKRAAFMEANATDERPSAHPNKTVTVTRQWQTLDVADDVADPAELPDF